MMTSLFAVVKPLVGDMDSNGYALNLGARSEW